MATRKRGNTWEGRVSVKVKGKYKVISKGGFKSKSQANAWVIQQESAKTTNSLIIEDKQLFTEYFENWMTLYRKDASNAQKRWYTFALGVYEKYLYGVRLDQLTRPLLQNFLNEVSDVYARSTNKRIKSYMCQAIKVALYDEKISKDPTLGLTYSGKDGKDKELKFLEDDQMRSLIHEIENKAILERSASDMMILSALQTGARYEELAALKWSDLTSDTISITKAWDQVDKEIKKTKTKSSVRVIDVPTKLINDLELWRSNYSVDDFIFTTVNKVTPITSASANKQLTRLLKDIQSPKMITFHGLRHTHASWLLSNDVNVQYVSERLGHSSITITLEIYAHLLEKSRHSESAKSVNLLNNIY